MSYQTVDELRVDALWRAGEPQSATSIMWDASLRYMNRIQQGLLLGGAIAVGRDLAASAGIYAHLVDLPITDWWWARKRALLTTTKARDLTATALTNASATGTLSATTTPSLVGLRMLVQGRETTPVVATHTSGTDTFTMDAVWPEDTYAGPITFFVSEYPLAADFLRFSAPPYVHAYGGAPIPVGSFESQGTEYPWSVVLSGAPSRAFQLGPQTVGLNAYDSSRSYRLEYEYVAMPIDLVAGASPILPQHHRSVLAVGTAMMLCFDKSDSARAQNLASEYRELVGRMAQEHRRMLSGGSNLFGQFRFRAPLGFERRPQPMGEMYLI